MLGALEVEKLCFGGNPLWLIVIIFSSEKKVNKAKNFNLNELELECANKFYLRSKPALL